MMLIWIFSAITFFTGSADFRTRLSCATDHPTTSYALIESKDSIELQILHHNGVQYMPIHQGLITIADLQTFQKDAELFSQMGTGFSVHFLKSECKVTSEDWSCLKKQPVQLGKLQAKSIHFSIYDKQVITKKSTANYKVAQINIVVGFYSHTLPMEYSPTNCRFYP